MRVCVCVFSFIYCMYNVSSLCHAVSMDFPYVFFLSLSLSAIRPHHPLLLASLLDYFRCPYRAVVVCSCCSTNTATSV